jgi:hypothetical protein
MKRAGRIGYRLLTVLSLLLLLATAVIWVRSYWVSDRLTWDEWPENRSFLDEKSIWCSRAGVRFAATRYLTANFIPPDDVHFRHDQETTTVYKALEDGWLDHNFFPTPRHYSALGSEWVPRSTVKLNRFVSEYCVLESIKFPLYFPCLLFAIFPAQYVLRLCRRRRIARRRVPGLSLSCGYDLRASSGRCPECRREELSANSRE